jgi:hypothetical protein
VSPLSLVALPAAEAAAPVGPDRAATAPEAPAAEPAPEALIRTALEGYAAGYSDLDAAAVQRVWPDVNRDALARAFDDLASQRVSLGDCRIDVSGAVAHAVCAGTSTWRPKIGDSIQRTDPRNWTFELEKTGANWLIVGARVQNK